MDPNVFKEIGKLEAAVQALHGRQDRTEVLVKDELEKINDSLKSLNEFMLLSKGALVATTWWAKIAWAVGGAGVLAMGKFLVSGSL